MPDLGDHGKVPVLTESSISWDILMAQTNKLHCWKGLENLVLVIYGTSIYWYI